MTDLLIVAATLVLLVSVVLPLLARPRHRDGRRIRCIRSLKQIGLDFRMWSNHQNDQFPWMVTTNQGGTLEFAGSTTVFLHFQAASNELSTPKILSCRCDTSKVATNDFSAFDNQNLGYFIGLTSDQSDPQAILSDDHNLMTNGVVLGSGVFRLTTNTVMGWTKVIHPGVGNIILSDGSAQQTTSGALQLQLQRSGLEVNRFAVP